MPVRSGSVSCQIRARQDCQPFTLPSKNGELAKSAVATGCSASADPELLHHVRLGGEVEVHLHGAGPVHHLRAVAADLPHVARHQRVAALRHHRHLACGPLRRRAEADEAGADLVGDRLHLAQMLVHLVAGLVDGPERRAGELELAARLEADVGAVLLQPDQLARLLDRRPAEAVAQPREHGVDRAVALVGQRQVVGEAVAELLVLGADAPVGRRLAARRRDTRRAGRGSRSRPPPDWGIDMEVSLPPRASRQP